MTFRHLTTPDIFVVVFYLVALCGLLGWVITYAISSHGDWRKTPEGRHLFTFRSAGVLLMALGTTNNLIADYTGRDVVRCIVIGIFACTVVHGFTVLLRAQRNGRLELLRRLHTLGLMKNDTSNVDDHVGGNDGDNGIGGLRQGRDGNRVP